MRTLLLLGTLVALWVAYAASPFVSVYRLVVVVDRHDVASLSERVDFTALRRSLSTQIAQAYLRVSGKGGDPNSLRDRLLAGIGASVADPIVAEFVSPQAFLSFLQTGQVPGTPEKAAIAGGLSTEALGSFWRAYLNSELGVARFFLDVPVDKPRQERFRLQFCLRSWIWKLCGIELPEPLLESIARELMRREKVAFTEVAPIGRLSSSFPICRLEAATSSRRSPWAISARMA